MALFVTLFVAFRALLGPCWSLLAPLGALLGPLGVLLGASWGILGRAFGFPRFPFSRGSKKGKTRGGFSEVKRLRFRDPIAKEKRGKPTAAAERPSEAPKRPPRAP